MRSLPIVFVPGLNCTGEVFASQVAALSGANECHIGDHRDGATIGEIAAAILARAPERFALVGFSLGGYLAFEMVRQAPARIDRLALLDTQATPESPTARAKRLALVAMVEDGRFAEAEEDHWPDVVHPSRRDDHALHEIKMRMAGELGPAVWLRHVRAIMARADSRPTLAAICVPTLVLVGDDDRLTTPERATEMAAGIVGSRLVVVPSCGHMAPIERPASVTDALLDWMNS